MRHERHLKRSGRDHDLIRCIAPAVDLDEVPALGLPDGTDAAAQHHRQRELPGVLGEVGHHVVTPGIRVRIAGERQARQAAVASGREQLQRVPPRAPGGRRLLRRLEDREVATLLSQEIPDRKPGLAAADYNHLEVIACGPVR